MQANLSFNTLCVLRDCVDNALHMLWKYGDRVLDVATLDNGNECETISECYNMLQEFIAEAQ